MCGRGNERVRSGQLGLPLRGAVGLCEVNGLMNQREGLQHQGGAIVSQIECLGGEGSWSVTHAHPVRILAESPPKAGLRRGTGDGWGGPHGHGVFVTGHRSIGAWWPASAVAGEYREVGMGGRYLMQVSSRYLRAAKSGKHKEGRVSSWVTRAAAAACLAEGARRDSRLTGAGHAAL